MTRRSWGVAALILALSAAPANAASRAPRNHAPDTGPRMAWSRFVDSDFSAARIVIRDPDGQVREVTHSADGVQDIDPKFSPDGSEVLFERDFSDGSTQIVVVAIDGTDERVLPLGCVDPCGADLGPSWAPDGRHVYFTRVVAPFDGVNGSAHSAVLYRAGLDGRGLTRVSPHGIDGTYEDYLASFAPAGYMVFLRIRNSDVRSAAFRRDADGTTTRLTPWSLDADELSVSPARRGPSRDLVVFETYGRGAPEGIAQAVATVPATCRSLDRCRHEIRYLTSPHSLPDEHFNPAWSPSGRQIAFVRFSSDGIGTPVGDIWRMRWNGAHQRPVSTSPLFEFRPAWGRP